MLRSLLSSRLALSAHGTAVGPRSLTQLLPKKDLDKNSQLVNSDSRVEKPLRVTIYRLQVNVDWD